MVAAASALAVLTAVGLAAYWFGGRDANAPLPTARPVVRAGAAMALPAAPPPVGAAAAPREATAPEPRVPEGSRAPLPEFMRGVPVDGELAVDAQGHFRPTVEARHLFQHFFLASGLEPDDVIRGRIALEIAKRLRSPAAEEAMDALDRFMKLRAELGSVSWEGDSRRRFERVRELRRSALGPELAEALYGEDERVIDVELELRAARDDPKLSAEERARRLADAERNLPPRVLEAREASRAPLRVQAEADRMRAAGATDQEIFAVREREFGSEAAARMAALDAERAKWRTSWAAYQAARNQLLADRSLGAAERSARLEALRHQYFAERDFARVRALDSAATDAATPAAPPPPAR